MENGYWPARWILTPAFYDILRAKRPCVAGEILATFSAFKAALQCHFPLRSENNTVEPVVFPPPFHASFAFSSRFTHRNIPTGASTFPRFFSHFGIHVVQIRVSPKNVNSRHEHFVRRIFFSNRLYRDYYTNDPLEQSTLRSRSA